MRLPIDVLYIVTMALSSVVSEIKNVVTLKSGSEVTQGQ